MRIGVFGGTFNPIHFGHLRAAEEAMYLLGLQKVLFVPAGNPPLKASKIASPEDRLSMVRIAIEGNKGFEVSSIEAVKAGKSYSVDTLKELSALNEGSELVFILGVDAFCDVHLWKSPGELLRLADFAVLARPGYRFEPVLSLPFIDIDSGKVADLDSGLIDRASGELEGGRRLELLRIASIEISATMIRKIVASGGSIRYLLPEGVESFIMSHGLYC